jgi:hypothetical protein
LSLSQGFVILAGLGVVLVAAQELVLQLLEGLLVVLGHFDQFFQFPGRVEGGLVSLLIEGGLPVLVKRPVWILRIDLLGLIEFSWLAITRRVVGLVLLSVGFGSVGVTGVGIVGLVLLGSGWQDGHQQGLTLGGAVRRSPVADLNQAANRLADLPESGCGDQHIQAGRAAGAGPVELTKGHDILSGPDKQAHLGQAEVVASLG